MKPLHSLLDVLPLRPLSLRSGSAPGRPRFLSAASGLVATGGRLWVIADDELHLGRFALQGRALGDLIRLFPGDLPAIPRRRKKRKPDLEVLLRLQPFAGAPHGALLALGSASRPQRRAGVLLPLDGRAQPSRCPQIIDASPLLAGLAREFDQINIEGGWAWAVGFICCSGNARQVA